MGLRSISNRIKQAPVLNLGGATPGLFQPNPEYTRKEIQALCHNAYMNGMALFVSRRNSNALRIMEFSIRNSTPSIVMRGFLIVA